MKTLQEYLELPYKMELIPDTEEGGYVVSFPELPGCLTWCRYHRICNFAGRRCEKSLVRSSIRRTAAHSRATSNRILFWTVSVTDSEIFASAISTARQTRRN